MKKTLVLIFIFVLMITSASWPAEKILNQYQQAGIWKVDRSNHRCLIERGVWDQFPFDKKEQLLQVIYVEEKTWWKVYDSMSGKLLGEVSSWGWKIHP